MECHIFRKDGLNHECFCPICTITQGTLHGNYTGVPSSFHIIRFCRISVREDRYEFIIPLLEQLRLRILDIVGPSLPSLGIHGCIAHMVGTQTVWKRPFVNFVDNNFIIDKFHSIGDEYIKIGITFAYPAHVSAKELSRWMQRQLYVISSKIAPEAAMSLRKRNFDEPGAASI